MAALCAHGMAVPISFSRESNAASCVESTDRGLASDGGIPKDEVNPVVEVGGHKGTLQSRSVGLQKMGRAPRPFGQLHVTHQLTILALAQRQVVKVH